MNHKFASLLFFKETVRDLLILKVLYMKLFSFPLYIIAEEVRVFGIQIVIIFFYAWAR